jgi:hypothetical protein
MGMDFDVAGINHEPLKIGFIHQLFQQFFPDGLVAPADEAPVRVAPPAVIGGQVTPRRTRAQNPEHRIDKLPVVLGNPSPTAFPTGQMWLQ